ncbi:MAG: ExeM/NucH family extracellular endonuclease [Xanthomonadaceae bacterium]|nr:ExeM/NucH family extracellular endonuclease [Xanthomonadaceae bacterium]
MHIRRSASILALALTLAACASLPPPRGVTPIGAVQGNGPTSPMLGREVTVDGIVTANFAPGLGLWALQGAPDGDAATSDALFLSGVGGPLLIGDHVRVQGRVAELGTEKDSTVTVLEVAGLTPLAPMPLPKPQSLAAVPVDASAWESLEAMLVRFPQVLTITGTQNAARFGEWQVALEGRAWAPTEIALPGDAANTVGRQNRARQLWLDDGDVQGNADTAMRRDIPRTGSTMKGVTGIVDERFGRYRLQLGQAPAVEASRVPSAPARMGDVRIAAMNLENLFNGDGKGGGFPTERGAKSEAAYLHQRAKLVAALAALDADVVALMELENDGAGPLSSEAQLVAALNAAQGGDWRAISMPDNASTDSIRVGLIYRASKVQPVDASATFEYGPFTDLSRPPLLQAFRAGSGPVFTVVANHFKSKGCRDAKGVDIDQRDGQGCWNSARLVSARLVDGWLRQRIGPSLDAPVAILGDLNAYAMEDPPRWLREKGWRDAFVDAGIIHPYSYVYDGQAGRLDHALLTPAMAARLAGAAEWHINADEPDVPERPDAPVTPLRSSDHDPLVIDLRLRTR